MCMYIYCSIQNTSACTCAQDHCEMLTMPPSDTGCDESHFYEV